MKIKNYTGKKFVIRENSKDRSAFTEVIAHGAYRKKIHLEKDDVWLDAGGNVGFFAIDIFDKVKSVISCEPSPTNFFQIMHNINLNDATNITAINGVVVGTLGNSPKRTFYLHENKRNTWMHSLIKTSEDMTPIEVQAFQIDDLIEQFNINKIKIDIEGGEWEVLSLISTNSLLKIKEMIMEYHILQLNDYDLKKFKMIISKLKNSFDIIDYPKRFNKDSTKQHQLMVHFKKSELFGVLD